MIFIFGFGHPITTTVGPDEERECPNCQHNKYWVLQKTRNFFTLFFIPVIPTSTKYYAFCPVCKEGISYGKEEFEERARKAAIRQQAINEDWDDDRLEAQLKNAAQ